MIATIGTILVWALIIFGGCAALFCAVIGFMMLMSYRGGR